MAVDRRADARWRRQSGACACWQEALPIAQIFNAAEAANEKGVIHRGLTLAI